MGKCKDCDYKEYIIRMLEHIDDERDLKQIYTIVHHKFKKTDDKDVRIR